MNKTTIALVATFLLGCLVALVAANVLQQPVQAQQAGDREGSPISALSFKGQGVSEYLVVFKEVDNFMYRGEEGDLDKVTGMAIYEVTGSSGKGTISLIATRYLDYDIGQWQLNTSRASKTNSVGDMKQAFLKAFESWKEGNEPEDE